MSHVCSVSVQWPTCARIPLLCVARSGSASHSELPFPFTYTFTLPLSGHWRTAAAACFRTGSARISVEFRSRANQHFCLLAFNSAPYRTVQHTACTSCILLCGGIRETLGRVVGDSRENPLPSPVINSPLTVCRRADRISRRAISFESPFLSLFSLSTYLAVTLLFGCSMIRNTPGQLFSTLLILPVIITIYV